ncbi:MAG: metallophosphoesterase family protein [Chitinophagaceae bacterium]
MKRIGLLSDTHHFLDPAIAAHFKDCDEIWHAGDFGHINLVQDLEKMKPLKGVYGNIDDANIRNIFPEQLVFTCEKVKVMMRHIGGSPPKYNPATKKELLQHQPHLFICGHSHILKIMYDESIQCLYINPGAAGKQGWHKVRTIVRFTIDEDNIKDCEVIELGKR